MVKEKRVFAHGIELDHIGIAVKDLKTASKIYKLLGFQTGPREIITDQGVGVLELALDESKIELLQPLGADSPVGRFLARHGEGLHHIALRVDDLKGRLTRCKEEGLRLIDEKPRLGAGGCLVAFIHPGSTGGVLIELVEDICRE